MVYQPFDMLSSDHRLSRIIGPHDEPSVVELWVLRLRVDGAEECRLLYGRVAASSFSEDRWRASDRNTFDAIGGGVQALIVRPRLYCSARRVQLLLRRLAEGDDLAAASTVAGVMLSSKDSERFGSLIVQGARICRPVIHLPTRSYFYLVSSRLSPSDEASVDSAAITSSAKESLLHVRSRESLQLASWVLERLKQETGAEFDGKDAWRFGDLELLAFPGLDDNQCPLFDVEVGSSFGRVRLDERLVGADLRIRMLLRSDGSLFHIEEHHFFAGSPLPAVIQVNAPSAFDGIVDAFELEIDKVRDDGAIRESMIRHGIRRLRSARTSIHVAGTSIRVLDDWLGRAIGPSQAPRRADLERISRQTTILQSTYGQAHPAAWVPVNRAMVDAMKRIAPCRTEGHFFPRLSDVDKTGRLQLAEWLRALIDRYPDHEVTWFDPYMEDVGVGLINRFGRASGSYIVMTNHVDEPLGRWRSRLRTAIARILSLGKRIQSPRTRLTRLVASCEAWARIHGGPRLRVVALEFGTLHDRMILVRSPAGALVAGFHLSNSIQKANQNHPMLVTPIPLDVLPSVGAYSDELLADALDKAEAAEGADWPSHTLLFDGRGGQAPALERPDHDFFALPRAGEILAWWTGDTSLSSLSGEALTAAVALKPWSEHGKMCGDIFATVPFRLWTHGLPPSDFALSWDALGCLLANSPAGENLPREALANHPALTPLLVSYLAPERIGALPPTPSIPGIVNTGEFIRVGFDELLKMGDGPGTESDFGCEVSYGDLYALTILWHMDPSALVMWIDAISDTAYDKNVRAQFVLKTAVRVIEFEASWSCSEKQLAALMGSKRDFIRWKAFHPIARWWADPPAHLTGLSWWPGLGLRDQLYVAGWLLVRATERNAPGRTSLVTFLLSVVPATISDEAFEWLLAPMRANTGRLSATSSWVMRDVLDPLIVRQSLSGDTAANIWLKDLIATLNDTKSRVFRHAQEGAYTDDVATLLMGATDAAKTRLASELSKRIGVAARILRTPFQRQMDWAKFDGEFEVVLWIHGLGVAMASIVQYNTAVLGPYSSLLTETRELVARRSKREWQRFRHDELVSYGKRYGAAPLIVRLDDYGI